MSRRNLLGLAGAAAVALPPGGKQLGSGMRGPFRFDAQRDRLVFRLGGAERWVIDAARFSGAPRLRHSEGDGWIAVELTGATYPGTEVPADFRCVIRRGLVGWRMRLKHAFGGLEADVPFEAWLAGAESARGRVKAPGTVCAVGLTGRIEASAGELSFRPDWTLRLEGERVASVTGLEGELPGDVLTVAALDPRADSLMADPPPHRTLVSVGRGDEEWSIARALTPPAGTALHASSSPFDVIDVETGERDGRLEQVVLARAEGAEPRLHFTPGGDLQGLDGRPLRLPLTNVRYAVAPDPAGDETALMADFAPSPTWVSGGGCTLQVGGGADVGPFEITGRNGDLTSVRCQPALLSFAAPLAGAVVGAAMPTAPARVSFVADGDRLAQATPPVRRPPVVRPKPTEEEKPPAKPPVERRPQVQPKPPAEKPPEGTVITRPNVAVAGVLLQLFKVPVLRTSDLLSLEFQFVNLKLETGAGQAARLVRLKPDDPTYIIVHFPPQHIGEEAFFETAAGFPVKDPKDPDYGKSGGGDTPKPPGQVETRLAGRSRLVFEVPKDIAEIPYTLPALLDWSNFNLSVAPTAQAPPLPPTLRPKERAPARVIPRAAPPDLAKPSVAPAVGGPASPLRLKYDPKALTADVKPRTDLLQPTSVVALARAQLTPDEPKPTETAIELPYRLILSPNASAGWVHSLNRVMRNKRVELWHTRMGVKSADGTIREDQYAYGWDDDQFRVVQVSEPSFIYERLHTLRAIWSPDFPGAMPMTNLEVPCRMSLNKRDRWQLVKLMADYTLKDCQNRVSATQKLMLSALGAWLDTRYAYDPKELPGLALEEWKHIATMGRDQYVKVVEMGYLLPFGHRAARVKVTERKFEVSGQTSIAYLKQRIYIVVREPVKTYPAPAQQFDGKRMPFRTVTLTTRVTPPLDKPDDPPSKMEASIGASPEDCFWPRVLGDDFQFHVAAEDWDSEPHSFTTPLVFVGAIDDLCFNRAKMKQVVAEYNAPKAGFEARIARPMSGQKVAYADTDGANPGDTALETETITFNAETDDEKQGQSSTDLRMANQPCFYPVVKQAAVRIPAAVVVTGQNGTVDIGISERYVQKGWGGAGNKGTIFAELLNQAPMNFPGDKGGGLALPNIGMGGLSRQFGPIGGGLPTDLGQDWDFNPEEFFKGAAAKLFGTIDLWEIIKGVFGAGKIPGLTIETEKDNLGVPKLIRAKYDWTPVVQDALSIFKAKCTNPDASATFELHAKVEVPITPTGGGSAPTYDSLAKLQFFTIDLYFIVLEFNRLEFTASSGTKPDVGVDIRRVKFGGPLTFINELQDALGDIIPGFSIDVSPTGVFVGYSLPIPTIACGVMSLQNISLGMGLTLPFTGAPVRLRFNFCERENPFLLSVGIFGGGGFFALEIVPSKGDCTIEASFEFGGVFELNIGVASGGAYIMAGIYFKYTSPDVELTGYVRCGGHLSVLGLITISAEFYLGLTYESATDRVWGQAKLTVEIDILFFSFSVTLTVEREFAHGGGAAAYLPDGERLAALGDGATIARLAGARYGQTSPSIAEMMTADDWKAYCEAFA